MILKVRADMAVGEDDRNAEALEQFAGPYARRLQQLRRIDRAGADDDVAACVKPLDPTRGADRNPHRPPALDQDCLDKAILDERDIGA